MYLKKCHMLFFSVVSTMSSIFSSLSRESALFFLSISLTNDLSCSNIFSGAFFHFRPRPWSSAGLNFYGTPSENFLPIPFKSQLLDARAWGAYKQTTVPTGDGYRSTGTKRLQALSKWKMATVLSEPQAIRANPKVSCESFEN
jgi:hypothetical protein